MIETGTVWCNEGGIAGPLRPYEHSKKVEWAQKAPILPFQWVSQLMLGGSPPLRRILLVFEFH